jgi:pyruvate ferredoxin oxidoreductase gamma subunit
MIEIRIHGRGGQGAVTAAELIAVSAFFDGKISQAFPYFGVERMGAPVEAYVRISEKKINLREQVYNPDYIIIQDPTLIGVVDVFRGAKKSTVILINTEKKKEQIKGLPRGLVVQTVPATQIAMDILGKPIINTAMLGAFAGSSKLIKPESVKKAIQERFGGELGEKNIMAMTKSYCHCNPNDPFCYLVRRETENKIDNSQTINING